MPAARALPLLLALTLLLGQQAGISHALSHVDPDTQPKDGIAHTTLCAKCSTFEQLSSVVPSCVRIDFDQASSAPPVGADANGIVRRTVTVFRSRAPPHLS